MGLEWKKTRIIKMEQGVNRNSFPSFLDETLERQTIVHVYNKEENQEDER